jgi:hypothetical protein
MILIYIYNTKNLDLLISNVNIFLSKSNIFNVVIYSNIISTIIHNITIINYETPTYILYDNIEYEYVIEVDDNFDLNILLSYEFDTNNIITCNYTNNKLENYFSEEEVKLLPKIIKNKSININNIPDSIKIYNLNNLKKINWFNTMNYLHNKCNELNININNQKLLILFQLLYPQYITLEEFKIKYIEEVEEKVVNEEVEEKVVNEDVEEKVIFEEVKKIKKQINQIYYRNSDVWLIKKSACKILLNNYILCLEDTILKKNNVRENRYDPYDKISVRLGKKFKLSELQNLNYFYLVEF